MELRDYQYKAEEDAERVLGWKTGAALLVMATGLGKTVVASSVIKRRTNYGQRATFLAPRREIVEQTADKLEIFGVETGIIMSGYKPKHGAEAQVASVDTLRSWIRRGKMRLEPTDLLVPDEAHRSLGSTYEWLIKAYLDAGADVLGMTATPMRSDGRGLGELYSHMVTSLPVVDAIKQGYLVKPVYHIPFVPDLSGVKVTGGDFDEKQLDEIMNQKHLVGDVVDNWLKNNLGLPTLVFASGIKHSMALRDQFIAAGIKAEHIDGDTPTTQRTNTFKRFRNYETTVLCNDSVFVEGTDIPIARVLLDVKPTKALQRHLQKCGRIYRPVYAEGYDLSRVDGRLAAIAASSKPDCRYSDHAGNFYRNGRFDRNIDWELTEGREQVENARKKAEKARVAFVCKTCSRVFSGQVYCPECGTRIEKFGKAKQYLDADLVQLTAEQYNNIEMTLTERDHREFYRMLMGVATETKKDGKRRFSDGWVYMTFLSKFNLKPGHDWQYDSPIEPSHEVKNYVKSRLIKHAFRTKKAAANA